MRRLAKSSPRPARWAALLGILGLGLLALAWYVSFGADQGSSVTTWAMGSYVQQTAYGGNQQQALQEGSTAAARLENQISWRVEGSDIARLNDAAGREALLVSPETYRILQTSLEVCKASGGAFDITVAPLSWLWDFDGEPTVPSPQAIGDALPLVDYTALSLLDGNTAVLKSKGTALDLGAVGKGAACDEILAAQQNAGASAGLVAVGGSVGVFGKKPGSKAWKIAVRDPESSGALGMLELKSGFVSTSGSYEKQFIHDGSVYHHLLDPATGRPADSGLVSVTVCSGGGALSDALSTACFVLGLEKSLPLLEKFHAQAVFIDEDRQITITSGLVFHLTNSSYRLTIL